MNKLFIFRIISVLFGIVVALSMVFLIVTVHVNLARLNDDNPIALIRGSQIVQYLFVHSDYYRLRKKVKKQVESTGYFESMINVDQKIKLPNAVFQKIMMFGEPRYMFIPRLNIRVCKIWSGLFFRGMMFQPTEDISKLESKVQSDCFTYQTDENGLKPTNISRKDDALTVLFLGDSYTEGVWVSPEKTFVHEFGQTLRSAGVSVNAINLGVRGYGPMEEDWVLEKFASKFDPRIVILNLFPNDVTADISSALVGSVSHEKYDIMFTHLSKIYNFCKKNDIKLVIVVIPPVNQFLNARGQEDFQNKVKSWADTQNILYLDPRAYFEKLVPRNLYLKWDGHFSVAGHRSYAKFLCERVSPLLLELSRSVRVARP